MTADHLSYQRATSVSLIGLGFQLIFALATLLYGIFGHDPAAVSASLAIMLGLPIWLGLALVFHQHKLERLEAMENEAFRASSAAQASVFEEAGTGENIQAAKLAWMHKWFLPILSLAIGAGYIVLGIYRFLLNGHPIDIGEWAAPAHGGWGISIGVGVAVVGFVFARFVAGMAKQQVWSLLNAGAATAVGSSLLGAALFIAHFAAEAIDREVIIKYLPLAIDIYMVALGAEIGLNFVLTLYRPRKPGEYLRPAFDSRILAFLAAPDRLAESISEAINYQFGFNVSSTWFYRLVSRSLALLILLGLFVAWFMTSFAVVRADQEGLLLRSGKVARQVGSGLVFKRPWPFDRVLTFPAEQVQTLTVGSQLAPPERPNAPILWTNATGVQEKYLIVQASLIDQSDSAGPDDDRSLALVAVEIPVQYVVTDLLKYIDLAQDGLPGKPDSIRQDLLSAVASRVSTIVLSRYSIDQILGAQRPDIGIELEHEIQAEFDRLNAGKGAGVKLIFAGIQGVHPPHEVAKSFEEVVASDQKKEAAIEGARADAIRQLGSVAGNVKLARQILAQLAELDRLKNANADDETISKQEQKIMSLIVEAGGQAAIAISDARKDRWVNHMGQRAKAVQYQGQIEAYHAAPIVYTTDLYLNAVTEMLQNARVWISNFDVPTVNLDQTEINPEIGGLTPTDLGENKKQE